MRHIIAIMCVGACSSFVPNYVGKQHVYKPLLLHNNKDICQDTHEECIITDDMYDNYNNHNVSKFNDSSDLVPNFKFHNTFLDCILALLFGGQWSAAFFWKAVQERILKDTLILVGVIAVVYELVTNIDIHV